MSNPPGPMHRARRWLQDVPLTDPVERRNAPMLQILLLLIAVPVPLLWLYRILATDIGWRPGETLSLASGLLLSAVALVSFMLVRRGRFQWAIRQLLVLVAAVLLLTYASQGMSAHTYELPLQVVWLFVAGMMIGRRALWAMYAVLAAALALGAISEARTAGETLSHLLGDAMIRSIMFLVIAVVVDRTTRSLRESLNEANERGHQLEAANQRLEAEIVAREQAQEQLLHAQKIETVGHMASGIAHDFNHLLSLILGYAERAKTADAEDELRRAVDGMESAARRASALTHGLLTFSRYDATLPQRLDAGEALDAVLPMLRQALGPRIALEVRRAAGPSPIVFDRVQFGLVLLNLATNAAQAMPGGGRVELGLETSAAPDCVRIWMRDEGPGIPAEVQARMFEPFFTTKPAGQGSGLGLAIVHNQVAAFDGQVRVESAEGTGTLIAIELPLAVEGDQATARSPAYQASM